MRFNVHVRRQPADFWWCGDASRSPMKRRAGCTRGRPFFALADIEASARRKCEGAGAGITPGAGDRAAH